ncbi:uroporphyrinogen-III C-methyltransferase [Litchfieldia salsa]|uniref:Uroporphyrinogen-III C-methyltransferase n=1 Tax=Litchfieldia salsa TaxID=930152 RepID=A0A1H0WL02_9BACI|nr:uroporphyrinogen-III C-methyltransferase [Litchfieldia salsa]SDP91221.1 uroporphyrinogen-III C-methyltransferase [Litchfieldia salsa]
MTNGKVYLVGAGPGDLKLMTIKGREAIEKADVILYDRLVNPKLLDFSSNRCELIYCGKLPDRHTLRQEEINELLVSKALEGKTVIRLKGGDPGVFGRVGEEAAELVRHEIAFEIIPGITSGIAAPLYAGIPVTHREYGETFAIVTAHDKTHSNINWEGLAKGIDTIAFYMGVGNLPSICENLIQYGKTASTPVILIQWGTFGRQKVVEGTLDNIAQKAKDENLTNPAITLVGEIVALRSHLKWFENKVLFSKQILLARTGILPSNLANELTEYGADVIEFPKWSKSEPILDDQILNSLEQFDHILFTSPECVEEFFTVLIKTGRDIRDLKAKVYGASTKSTNALRQKGLLANVSTEEEIPAGKLLVVKLEHEVIPEKPLLNRKNDEIYTISKLSMDEGHLPIYKRMMDEASINTVIFPSSRSVQCLLKGLEYSQIDSKSFLSSKRIVCMGEKTKAALNAQEVIPDVISEHASIESLLNSLVNNID